MMKEQKWKAENHMRHGVSGKSGTQASACEELQISAVAGQNRALTNYTMEEVVKRSMLVDYFLEH